MASRKNAALGFILVTILVDVIGMAVIIPVIPDLIKNLTGEGVSEAAGYGSWLIFSFALMQFVFSPILGSLSDRFGRRPILLISLFGLGVDYIFHAYAPTLSWLFVGRVIAGIAGASFTTATAYIADITPPEKRAQNFGLIGAAFGLGFIIGPAIGAFTSQWGTKVTFLVAAGLTLLNFFYGYFILPESLPENDRRKFEWKRANPVSSLLHLRKFPVISGLVVSLILVYIAAHAVQSNWSFFCDERFGWKGKEIGYSLTFVGVMVAIVQGGLIRIVIPKIGQKNSVFAGLFLYGMGLLLFGFATEGWMMYAFLVPYALGGLCGPALQGIMSAQVPSNEQGELQGALTSLISVTTIAGPLIMNNLFSYFTSERSDIYFPGAPFILGAILTFLSIFLAVRPLKNLQQKV